MRITVVGLLLGLAAFAAPVHAAPVDLSTWTAENYASVSGFPDGTWTVAGGGVSVTQSENGQPTVFYSDFAAHNTDAVGKIRVTGTDDDFIGFVFGFDPGDSTSAGADYLLVDWKSGNQVHDFGSPSTDPGGLAPAGLAVSRISGVPSADEFWQHTTYSGGGLTELTRATNLGSTGWAIGVEYEFEFVFLPTQIQVFVDGVKEIDVVGSFSNGRMGFYNFSQAGVTYSAFTVAPQTTPIPEPGSLILIGTVISGAALRRRRRRRA